MRFLHICGFMQMASCFRILRKLAKTRRQLVSFCTRSPAPAPADPWSSVLSPEGSPKAGVTQ